MNWARIIFLVALGYLCGSIPFSYLVARARGVDLRQVGSGNTGASNTWRALGFRFFLIALVLDIVKGFVPTAIAYRGLDAGSVTAVAVGLAAMLGHVYPVFMNFRGGKAVATTGGVMLALQPMLLVASAVVWTIIYQLTGYPSVASLLGIVIIAIGSTMMTAMGRLDAIVSAFIWISLVLVFYLHRANINRLMHGTENRVGRKAK